MTSVRAGKRVEVPTLKNLVAFVRAIGGTHAVYVENIPAIAAQKLLWLETGDRHFLTLTGEALQGTLRSYLRQALQRAEKKPGAVVDVWKVLGAGLKAAVLLRFRNKGHDARPMRPLKPATIARKRALGRDAPEHPGIDTGKLYRALERGRFVFLKAAA
jgi:uncharacterized membrane protein